MFGKLFAPYGRVWNICNTITDTLGLSLLWLVCCLPLVTAGAATAALYDAAVRSIRFRQEGPYRRFLQTFRRELKTGIGVSLLWGAVLGFCCFVLFLLDAAAEENSAAWVWAGAYRVAVLLPLGAACWSCAALSRFDMGFRRLISAVVQLIPTHPLATLIMAGLTSACVWVCGQYFLPVFFLPAACAVGWSIPAEKVFEKYGGSIRDSDAEKHGAVNRQ